MRGIRKIDIGFLLLRQGFDLRIVILQPLPHERLVALDCSVQRLLAGDAELRQETAYRIGAQFYAELILDKLGHHLAQGCSTLFTEGHRKYGFETAESGGVAVLRDCVGLIEPENIVGEASNSREDARIFSNARCVFAERDIARVVKLIFDPPVHANGDSSAICVNHAVAQIE